MKFVLILMAALGLGYLLILTLMTVAQHSLVFQPSRTLAASPAAASLPYEDVTIRLTDKETVHGWFLPVSAARATVLFLHGNAGNISHRLQTLELLHSLGLQVLIIDYRGYGQSLGNTSEMSTYEDAAAAWDWLVEHKGIRADRLIIYGRSLGGGVASWLASRRSGAALILDSTFISVAEVAKQHYWWLPVERLLKIQYDNASRMPALTMPLMIFHSTDDEVISFRHGERLFELAPQPKSLISLSGSHNTLVQLNHAIYYEHLNQLVDDVSRQTTR